MSKTRTRGWGVLCPFCGDADAQLTINLNELDGECLCSACDATFTVAEAVALTTKRLERWQSVAAWIALAPELPKDD